MQVAAEQNGQAYYADSRHHIQCTFFKNIFIDINVNIKFLKGVGEHWGPLPDV